MSYFLYRLELPIEYTSSLELMPEEEIDLLLIIDENGKLKSAYPKEKFLKIENF